ncbi:MAG: hypothetical protein AB7E80_07060 [Hyphomicrobiaceae bacterium]
MFKRITIAAVAAAVAVVSMPSASEAHHKRAPRAGCALTKMLVRAPRVVVHHVRAPRVVHVRKRR